MMIIARDEMLAIEQTAFDGGVSAEALMDEVGRRMAWHVRRLAPAGPGNAVIFAGKGNNAGDALVAAGHLQDMGWSVWLRFAGEEPTADSLPGKKLAVLVAQAVRWDDKAQANLKDYPNVGDVSYFLMLNKKPAVPSGGISRWNDKAQAFLLNCPDFDAPFVALDGLLGIGARGALRGSIKDAARELNCLRREHGALVFALDIPTGLDADTGAADEDAVVADFTLTVGFAKSGLVADGAVDHVGHLEIIELPELTRAAENVLDAAMRGERSIPTVAANLAPLLPPRPFETNKTRVGRVGILAGGVGTTGAALMCSLGALRGGAGLVTLLADEKIYSILAAGAPHEVMVKPISSPLDAMDEKFDVLAVGPGLHPDEANDELRSLIERWEGPMVVDAGALSALAQNVTLLDACAGPRLLTPHPGEMERLWKSEASLRGRDMKTLPRADIVRDFTDRYPVALLLKGARTLVGQSGRPLAYNTTGNPGMATGGMGDVLTGVCAALLGQKLDVYDAGRFGAWLCGRAAELAARDEESEQSLIATDLPRFFGAVFRELRLAAL